MTLMKLRINKLIFFTSFFLSFFAAFSSYATVGLIRDAQTEKFLHELSDPIFKAANLNPNNIKIYIVNDDSINAFVSGGQNVFINTGLIVKYNTPDALIGVIAHETGHIVGGHLARSSEEMKNANTAMLLSYLLGIGAIAAGSADAGQGIIMGGMNIAEKSYMKFTRGQEEAADKYAMQYLRSLQYPAKGLITLLEFFEEEMRAYEGQIDEYALSHPVSRKRIDFLKNNFATLNYSDHKINQKLQPLMNTVLLKLEGFMQNPDSVLKKYSSMNGDNAKYVKSIAYYRKGDYAKSLQLLDSVIKNKTNDGFLYELQGQILFESGRVSEAAIAYKKALELLDKSEAAQYSAQAKIYFALAILTLKTDDKSLIDLAIKKLKEAQNFESDNPFLFKQFSVAYDKIGDEARSYLALAEYNFLIGDNKKTKKYIKLAKKIFEKEKDKNSIKTELMRLNDLSEFAKDKKDKIQDSDNEDNSR